MNTLDVASAAPHQPADDPTSWEVDDDLWAALQPLLVIDKPRKKPGRPRANDRRIFNGLIWLARTGAQWATLPRPFGPTSTAHDRFQEWVLHGCLAAAWALLLEWDDDEISLQWEWQAADGCIVKAPLGTRGRMASQKRPAGTHPTGARAARSVTC
jgi:transposase